MMTYARLAEIREAWSTGGGMIGDDIRDLLAALDAHRKAVSVAAATLIELALMTKDEWGGRHQTAEEFLATLKMPNDILAAAIKAEQEKASAV